MVSKMKKSKKPLSSEATANLEATKSLCSGGPPLFYYDPDGSRAMNSITSARAIVRVGQTLESNSRISLKSSNTVRLTPLDNSNSDFGNDIGITDWSQEFDGFDDATSATGKTSLESRPKLHKAFLQDKARASWGRSHKVGKIRKKVI